MEFVGIIFTFFMVLAIIATGVVTYIAINELIAWQEHILDLAKKIKETGAIGIYLDNSDIYYMCQQGFKEEHYHMLRKAPSAQAVYTALSNMILKIHDNISIFIMGAN